MRFWADDILGDPSLDAHDDTIKSAATTVVLKCLDAVLAVEMSSDMASEVQFSAVHKAARV